MHLCERAKVSKYEIMYWTIEEGTDMKTITNSKATFDLSKDKIVVIDYYNKNLHPEHMPSKHLKAFKLRRHNKTSDKFVHIYLSNT